MLLKWEKDDDSRTIFKYPHYVADFDKRFKIENQLPEDKKFKWHMIDDTQADLLK